MLSTDVLMFCRWGIGLTFLASAAGKLRDLPAFRQAVVELAGLPATLGRSVAIGTVAAEGLVVLGMAVGHLGLPVGFGLAAALLVLFSIVLATALRRRMTVSCNCFGAGEGPVSWYDLARNAALLACCGAGLAGYAVADRLQPAGALIMLTGLMAGCFVLIVTNVEDIVELLGKPYLVE